MGRYPATGAADKGLLGKLSRSLAFVRLAALDEKLPACSVALRPKFKRLNHVGYEVAATPRRNGPQSRGKPKSVSSVDDDAFAPIADLPVPCISRVDDSFSAAATTSSFKQRCAQLRAAIASISTKKPAPAGSVGTTVVVLFGDSGPR